MRQKKLTTQQNQINDMLKEVSSANQKYASTLELANKLKSTNQDLTEEVTKLKLEASEAKLKLQEKS